MGRHELVLESGRCKRGLDLGREVCMEVCRDGRGFEVGQGVSILTYSRTFAMLYLLWTGDALAAALAATACKTWCTPMGMACVVARARGAEGSGPGVGC